MTPDRIIKQAMRPHRASERCLLRTDGEGGQRRRRRVTRLSNLRFRAYEIITYSLFVRSFSCSTFHSVSPFPLFWRSGIRSPLLSASISPLGSRQPVIQFSRLHAERSLWGPSISDVSCEVERGCPLPDKRNGGCVNKGKGVKMLKLWLTPFMDDPYLSLSFGRSRLVACRRTCCC